MERLMMLRLRAQGCAAEVSLNGLPVLRVANPGGCVTLPVHEYALAGRNRLSFTAGALSIKGEAPPPLPKVSQGRTAIQVMLALCHRGQSPDDPNARVLHKMSWSPGLNEKHDWPFTFAQDVELPVTFPRWRWLDAPVITLGPEFEAQVLGCLQDWALDFQRGDPEGFLTAARLRTEELALAYQRNPAAWTQAVRDHFQALFETQALATVLPPEPGAFVLRPVAQGRLVECLAPDGGPVLRTAAPKPPLTMQTVWPLRIAQVEGKLYVLR